MVESPSNPRLETMIYTLFFSRLRDRGAEAQEQYVRHSDALEKRVSTEFPGFVDTKTFTAEDGERLTVVRFRDAEAQRAWASDDVHNEAQERGRQEYYDEYRITLCQELRSHGWVRETEEAADGA